MAPVFVTLEDKPGVSDQYAAYSVMSGRWFVVSPQWSAKLLLQRCNVAGQRDFNSHGCFILFYKNMGNNRDTEAEAAKHIETLHLT